MYKVGEEIKINGSKGKVLEVIVRETEIHYIVDLIDKQEILVIAEKKLTREVKSV